MAKSRKRSRVVCEIDLHVHTDVGSMCSVLGLDDLSARAHRESIGTIAVTDHGNLRGVRALAEHPDLAELAVIAGMEVTTERGDFLVYASMEALEELEDALRAGVREFERLVQMGLFSREHLVVWAHPFGAGASGLHPPDSFSQEDLAAMVAVLGAVEGVNGNYLTYDSCQGWPQRADSANIWATIFAEEFGLPITGGSDAHAIEWLGTVRTAFDREISDWRGLRKAVRSGGIVDRTEDYFGKNWREEVATWKEPNSSFFR